MDLAVESDDLSLALTRALGEDLSSIIYTAGSVIFKEGESEGNAYFIERGLVEISCNVDGEKTQLCVLGPGELFGEMAPLDRQQRSATATALYETEVMPISANHLQKLIDETHPLVNLLLRLLLNRFRSTQQRPLLGGIENATENNTPVQADRVLEAARVRALGRAKFEKALREAIRRREFELYYQPVVSLRDRNIVGFEALIRWCSPDMGLLPPDKFISIAEETGLIIPIGLWVIEHAFHNLARFQTRFNKSFPDRPPLFMSANVSGRQLESPSDVDIIVGMIRNVGVDPASVKLEITEAVLMSNPNVVRIELAKLKNLGVTLAIDDFGIGYSSLSYLHRFQIDTLKIDRSFVNTMLTDRESNQIVKSIVGLACGLNMDIIAEGVERPEEFVRLQELGCNLAQGYLFGQPMPSDEIMEMLEKPLEWSTPAKPSG